MEKELFFERFIPSICSGVCIAIVSVNGEEVSLYDVQVPLPEDSIVYQTDTYNKREVIQAVKDNLNKTTVIVVTQNDITVYVMRDEK